MDNRWKLYVHINKINGKKYVGITSKEKVEHRWESGCGYKENPHFYSAIEKYGWDSFEHIVMYSGLSFDDAIFLEKLYIRIWNLNDRNFGYNMTTGGEGTPGYHPSEETRKKLSIARMKENLSEETLKKRSDGLRGRKFSDAHKRKIGDANSRSVTMFDKNGNKISVFKSMSDAETETGVGHSHISQCCNGFRKTAGGYLWSYSQ